MIAIAKAPLGSPKKGEGGKMASEIGQVAYTEAKSLELGSESESSRIFLLELGGESTGRGSASVRTKKMRAKKGEER